MFYKESEKSDCCWGYIGYDIEKIIECIEEDIEEALETKITDAIKTKITTIEITGGYMPGGSD